MFQHGILVFKNKKKKNLVLNEKNKNKSKLKKGLTGKMKRILYSS